MSKSKMNRTRPLIDNQRNPNLAVPSGPDLSGRVAVQVDKRTTIYVRPGNEAESEKRHKAARDRIINNLKS